MPSLRLGN